jgi:hypothetical protein
MVAFMGIGHWELLLLGLLCFIFSPLAIAFFLIPKLTQQKEPPIVGNPNLAPCPDCGRMISIRAVACPACGRPNEPAKAS